MVAVLASLTFFPDFSQEWRKWERGGGREGVEPLSSLQTMFWANVFLPKWNLFLSNIPLPSLHLEGEGEGMRRQAVLYVYTEAKFLDESQTKDLRVFLLAIQSHLYSFALRFLFLQTHVTSYSFCSALLYTVKEKGGKPDRKPHPLPRNPYRNLKSENSQDYAQKNPKKLYVHEFGFFIVYTTGLTTLRATLKMLKIMRALSIWCISRKCMQIVQSVLLSQKLLTIFSPKDGLVEQVSSYLFNLLH